MLGNLASFWFLALYIFVTRHSQLDLSILPTTSFMTSIIDSACRGSKINDGRIRMVASPQPPITSPFWRHLLTMLSLLIEKIIDVTCMHIILSRFKPISLNTEYAYNTWSEQLGSQWRRKYLYLLQHWGGTGIYFQALLDPLAWHRQSYLKAR